MTRPLIPSVDRDTKLLPEPTMQAIAAYVAERNPGASPEEIAAAVEAWLIANPTTGASVEFVLDAINDHANAAAPHPAYDDIPSLALLFENGLV